MTRLWSETRNDKLESFDLALLAPCLFTLQALRMTQDSCDIIHSPVLDSHQARSTGTALYKFSPFNSLYT